MKTILVPTDFSKRAKWALKFASRIAKQAKARVLLLHIVEHPSSDSFNVEGQVAVDAGGKTNFTPSSLSNVPASSSQKVLTF